jgi:1,4-alpha-glucan branching enzyme
LTNLSTDIRLEPFRDPIKRRYNAYQKQLANINQYEGGLAKFSEGYKDFGFIVDAKNGVKYREWAPGVVAARVIGDFSQSIVDLIHLLITSQTDGITRPTQ